MTWTCPAAVSTCDRRRGLGGSDIAALLGVDEFRRNQLDVYLEKVGAVEPMPKNEQMELGLDLEPWLLQRYLHRRTAIPTSAFKFHAEQGIEVGHADDFVELLPGRERRGVELKNRGHRANLSAWGEDGTDQVPAGVLVQCQWYMHLYDEQLWDVIAMLGGSSVRIYTLERSQKLIDLARKEAETFWRQHVETQTPPEPQDLRQAQQAWARATKGVICTLPQNDETQRQLAAVQVARQKVKDAAKLDDAAKFWLRKTMEDAPTLVADGHVVATCHEESKRKTDYDKLEQDFPDAYDACVTETTFRRLLTKDKAVAKYLEEHIPF